jgi:hypothetical protein
MIKDNSLQFNITSFVRQARKYSNALAAALILMRTVCEARTQQQQQEASPAPKARL